MTNFINLREQKIITKYDPPHCAVCNVALKPAIDMVVQEDGSWDSLSVSDGIIVNLAGGYGMAIDPMPWEYRNSTTLVICQECIKKTEWLNQAVTEINGQW